MPLLFSYGTLQQADVQIATFGRKLAGRSDELVGFTAEKIAIDDAEVVRATGMTHYDNAAHNGRQECRIAGMALEITADELAAADKYEEIAAYVRIETILASGKQAWVYVYYKSVPGTERNDG